MDANYNARMPTSYDTTFTKILSMPCHSWSLEWSADGLAQQSTKPTCLSSSTSSTHHCPIVLFALFDLDSEEEELLENHHATYQISRMGCHFSAASILITLTEAIAVAVVGSYTLFIVIPLTYTSPNDLDVRVFVSADVRKFVLVVNIVLLMHVRHTSANLLVNGVATVGLYIGSVKIVGLLSLEISMAF